MTKSHRRYPVPRSCTLPTVFFIAAVLAACATPPLPLNSERIESRYGSYAVRVLQQDERVRISSLESRDGMRATTRTLAFTLYAEAVPALASIDTRIRAGASIGSTFRSAGFAIEKPPVEIGALMVHADQNIVAQLMAIELPATLALHAYHFDVSRDAERYRYASIVELHHPDYLTERELLQLYSPPLAPAPGEAGGLRSELGRLLLALSSSAAP